ncbi:MAG: hypothetical protein ACO3D0_02125 [Ilumatobacteraceae bacterium]
MPGESLVSDGDPPPSGTAAWYVREAPLSHGRCQVRCHLDDRHPDGTIVADPGPTGDLFTLWHAHLDDAGRSVVDLAPGVRPGAPHIWLVALPQREPSPDGDRNGDRATLTLVAFASDHRPPGTIVSDAEFFHMPVPNDAQIGAIRWWPEEAVVDQVYVADEWRRLHVATILIYTASAFHQHQGWPGRLHSDGRRTRLGVSLVTGLRHPDRIAPLHQLLAPMERAQPPDDTDGVGPSA